MREFNEDAVLWPGTASWRSICIHHIANTKKIIIGRVTRVPVLHLRTSTSLKPSMSDTAQSALMC